MKNLDILRLNRMKIIILTGKFGMGHYSASLALKQEIERDIPSTELTIIDFFEYSIPKSSKLVYKSFDLLVKYASPCYNFFQTWSDEFKFEKNIVLEQGFFKSIESLLKEFNPNVLISTFPLCSQLISRYKEKYKLSLPLITCITDVSSQQEWIHPNTDYYLVADAIVSQSLIDKGITEDKIRVIGIPVKNEFKNCFKECSKKEKSSKKNILIMGGGLGLLPKESSFYERLNQLNNLRVTIITGNNEKLFNLIYGKYQNINVIQYTNQVYQYMLQSDIVISKPGGITVFEAIYTETPILVIEPFLKQEIKNANFILKHQIGKVITKKELKNLILVIDFIYNEQLLKEIEENMQNLRKQFDASELIPLISSFNSKDLCDEWSQL